LRENREKKKKFTSADLEESEQGFRERAEELRGPIYIMYICTPPSFFCLYLFLQKQKIGAKLHIHIYTNRQTEFLMSVYIYTYIYIYIYIHTYIHTYTYAYTYRYASYKYIPTGVEVDGEDRVDGGDKELYIYVATH
jgi:hypothetical protein